MQLNDISTQADHYVCCFAVPKLRESGLIRDELLNRSCVFLFNYYSGNWSDLLIHDYCVVKEQSKYLTKVSPLVF